MTVVQNQFLVAELCPATVILLPINCNWFPINFIPHPHQSCTDWHIHRQFYLNVSREPYTQCICYTLSVSLTWLLALASNAAISVLHLFINTFSDIVEFLLSTTSLFGFDLQTTSPILLWPPSLPKNLIFHCSFYSACNSTAFTKSNSGAWSSLIGICWFVRPLATWFTDAMSRNIPKRQWSKRIR